MAPSHHDGIAFGESDAVLGFDDFPELFDIFGSEFALRFPIGWLVIYRLANLLQ